MLHEIVAVRRRRAEQPPPYLPTIYNNDFQIFQSPGYVVIAPEMIHSARSIPLDGPAAPRQEPAPMAGVTKTITISCTS
jgi:hypothetical protein